MLETVGRAARALLGASSADLKAATQFLELGGDSLSALSFSNLLRELFDVEVPVGVVLSPANDLQAVADYIEAERVSGLRRPSPASVHGADAAEVSAAELALEKFIDADTLRAASSCRPRPRKRKPADRCCSPARTATSAGSCAWTGWSGWPR